MPLKLNLAIPNKAVHAFIGLVVVVALVVGVYAYTFPPSFLGHGGDQIWINTLTGETDLQAAIDGGMFGDITAVLAGVGLLGGGASGNVTLNADTTYLQRRVSSSCAAGSSIRAISSTGTVTCETDDAGGSGDITGVAAGTGLTGGGVSGNVTLNADTGYLQRRVSSSCVAGSSIRAISSTGTVTCETDDAGTGDITGVTAGTGLGGGGLSGNVTLNADTTYLQRRVSSSCAAGSSIRAISSTGTVTCETDDAGGGGLNCTTRTASGTGTATAVCIGDEIITGGGCRPALAFAWVKSAYFSGNNYVCSGLAAGGSNVAVTAYARCCQ